MSEQRRPQHRAGLILWIALGLIYLLVPVALEFTPHKLLGYRAAPNEVVRTERHDVIQTKQMCRADDCDNVPAIWRDKRTGTEFRRGDFREHRLGEARRLGWSWFAYIFLGGLGVASIAGPAASGLLARAVLFSTGIAAVIAIQIYLEISR